MKKPSLIFFLAILSFSLFFSCAKKQGVVPIRAAKSSDDLISSFTLNAFNPVITGTIDQSAKKISLTLPSGTDITALVPTIIISDKASISPASGIAQDFTKAVNYTVTAEDGSVQVYKVTVLLQSWFTEAMAATLIENATYASTYGVIGQINSTYHTYWTAVSYPKDTIITAASASGIIPSFGYNSEWLDSLSRIIQGTPPETTAITESYYFKGAGSYDDGSAFSSNYVDTGRFAINDLVADLPFNIAYIRSERITSETGSKNMLTDRITWTSSNILVSKALGVILSGTASVSLDVTISGQPFKYLGTITFSGNNKASLQLDSGGIYQLQW